MTGTSSSRGRGRPPRGDQPKRAAFNTRLRSALKERLEAEAQAAGRSLSEEIEDRLEKSFQVDDLLDSAFGAPHRKAAGRLIGALLQRGGGSEALIEFASRVRLPDATKYPVDLARSLIEEAAYNGDHPLLAQNAAWWRQRLGPDVAGIVEAAYQKLRSALKAGEPREVAADPEIQAAWKPLIDQAAANHPKGVVRKKRS